MVDVASFLFLYTPFPYFFLIYFMSYRHELGRVLHPFRDHDTLRDWVLVFKGLKIVPDDTPVQAYGTDLLKLIPIAVVGVVVWWSAPFLSFGVWYQAVVIQVFSAALLFSVAAHLLGPAANRPRRDHMRYPRLGSRIRHFEEDDVPKGERYD